MKAVTGTLFRERTLTRQKDRLWLPWALRQKCGGTIGSPQLETDNPKIPLAVDCVVTASAAPLPGANVLLCSPAAAYLHCRFSDERSNAIHGKPT